MNHIAFTVTAIREQNLCEAWSYKMSKETHGMIKEAYSPTVMDKSDVFEWYKLL